jgi:Regulator of ribonuclease activity B
MRYWRESQVRAVERIADAAQADARVLDHLAKLGCDPSEPRECRHYLYVPAEPGAREVARALNGDGWDAECEELADLSWLVTATIFTGLTDAGVRATRSRLQLLASYHGGEYDGWEAAAD